MKPDNQDDSGAHLPDDSHVRYGCRRWRVDDCVMEFVEHALESRSGAGCREKFRGGTAVGAAGRHESEVGNRCAS